jgi:nucleoid-associated protein YgaU
VRIKNRTSFSARPVLHRSRVLHRDETEIRQAMAARGIGGVLVVNVTGDTGVQQQYTGTIVDTSYTGTSSGNAMVMGNAIYGSGMSSGAATTTSTPIYHYSRAVAFEARLSDPQTSRKFWVVSGQTKSGGSLFMGDTASAADAAAAIFNELQTKGLIGVHQA